MTVCTVPDLEEAGDTHASGEKPFTLAQLPDYGRDGNALAFIIGNSKAMWPRFLSWLRDHPDVKDPVDAYTAETIDRAIANFIAGDAFICETYLIHMCNVTRPRVDLTQSCVCCESFACVLFLIHMCAVSHCL